MENKEPSGLAIVGQSGVVLRGPRAQGPWTFLRLYYFKIIDNVDAINSKFPKFTR
jgi:hypothetical protein